MRYLILTNTNNQKQYDTNFGLVIKKLITQYSLFNFAFNRIFNYAFNNTIM